MAIFSSEVPLDSVLADRQISRIHEHDKSPAGIDDLLLGLPKGMMIEVPGTGRVAFCDNREWIAPGENIAPDVIYGRIIEVPYPPKGMAQTTILLLAGRSRQDFPAGNFEMNHGYNTATDKIEAEVLDGIDNGPVAILAVRFDDQGEFPPKLHCMG